jgi:hypothetical protein
VREPCQHWLSHPVTPIAVCHVRLFSVTPAESVEKINTASVRHRLPRPSLTAILATAIDTARTIPNVSAEKGWGVS